MILDTILEHKERELAERQAAVPLRDLARKAKSADPPRDFAAALRQDGIRLIAEIKRASPSKGVFAPDLDPAALAQTYESGGASALSVLTDARFFQGSLADLAAARAATALPALRKDFTTDEYHVVEARAAGADAILLIVAALQTARMQALLRCAEEWGMATIVEVHTAEEVEQALAVDAAIIGVNNRNLHTFETTLETTAALRALIPSDRLLVSESGIHTPADVAQLHAWDVDAMLIGEALVTAHDTAAKVAALVAAAQDSPVTPAKAGVRSRELHMTTPQATAIQTPASGADAPRVKICGIMALADAEAAVAHGADFLGFNFVRGRRRCMTVENTRKIIQALGSACPPSIGIFLDEDPATVRHVVREGGLQYAQLCGSESPEYCSELSTPYWKVVNLHSAADYERMPPYAAAAAFLLEGADNGPGGTGQTWDWGLASGAPRDRPYLIAGGLTPDNVSAAIAQARPWGVDVSSGVETGGKKDPDKIAAFIKRAKDSPPSG